MSRIHDDVWFSGLDAALDGKSLTDNPYKLECYRQIWIDGFNSGLRQLAALEVEN